VLLGIDSLRHRAAVAEIFVLLSPEAKPMAVKIIEESSNYGARYIQNILFSYRHAVLEDCCWQLQWH
jgi:hypothetical protein